MFRRRNRRRAESTCPDAHDAIREADAAATEGRAAQERIGFLEREAQRVHNLLRAQAAASAFDELLSRPDGGR